MAKRIAGHARRSRSSRPAASPRAALARLWVKRSTATILSLGALAAAITAIVSLWPAPDPEDSASFTAIRVTPQVPFSEYVQRLKSTGPQKFGRALGGAQTDSATTTTRRRTSPPATPTTTTTTRRTGTPPPTSSTTSPSPAASALGGFVPPPAVSLEDIDEIASGDPMLQSVDPGFRREALRPLTIGSSVDPEGNPVPPEKAAEQILRVLKDARVTTASREPVGAVVSAEVDLAGLRDKPVELTWSMWQSAGETRLHGDWLNRNLAYRLEARTDHDTTTIDLWVPLPAAAGPYFVRVDLAAEGSPLASGATEPFD